MIKIDPHHNAGSAAIMSTINLSDDEALVLFEFLARVTDAYGIDANQEKRLWTVIDHPAEFWALISVQGALEKILVEPFASNYGELVALARQKVMARCDPEGSYGTDPEASEGTQTFIKDVIDESKRQPVLVDFWAEWCGPCKQLAPILEKVVRAAKGKVKLVKMDIDKHPAVAGQLGIQSIPAVFAFINGQPVDSFLGALPESQVVAFIERVTKGRIGGEEAGPNGGHRR
jgi:thioredoxin